ncbi:MAG: hypothetical protein OHK0012_03690 [Synechococcales cyanobacterium]
MSSPRSWIVAALHRQGRDPASRYVQMATVDPQGFPRNRTVVFRGWLGNTDSLLLATDRRSQKVEDLRHHPWVELCWYFAKPREQFRLLGTAVLHDHDSRDPLRQQTWQQISPSGRLLWFWPTPGASQAEPQSYATTLSESEPVPNTFVLVVVHPQEVDHLQLRGNELYPQLRTRWQWQGSQWVSTAINP